jgi:hypothetical protein
VLEVAISCRSFGYSCTIPDPGGVANITNAPAFVSSNDYHLAVNSPCIDKGTNALCMATALVDGQPRVFGGVVDIGADEDSIDCYGPPPDAGWLAFDVGATCSTIGLFVLAFLSTGQGGVGSIRTISFN